MSASNNVVTVVAATLTGTTTHVSAPLTHTSVSVTALLTSTSVTVFVPSAIVSEDTFSSQSCELHTSWLSANLFCKCIVTRYSSPPHMHTPTQAATLNVNLV